MDLTGLDATLLETALDNINTSICIVDENCIVKFWNAEAVRFYKISAREIVGKPVTEFFPKALIPKVIQEQKAYEDVYNNPKEGYYIVISAVPLYDWRNRLIGGISIDKDITDYINTQALLEKTSDNIKLLEEQINAINQSQYSFSGIIGQNHAFMEAVQLCKDVSDSAISVLLLGESGTGKEVIARGIHAESKRKGPFIPINCSAIPASLFESELFGYEGGAFTGAQRKGKIGKIEAADKGTLFLDEIGDLPLEMQPKLLRVLEANQLSRLGSDKDIEVDVRIITATNLDLKQKVDAGTFRQDLFYRLNSIMVDLPALRERKEDIPVFIHHFLETYCMAYGVNIPEIPDEVLRVLQTYEWEGNIRELKNVMERIVILHKKKDAPEMDVRILPEYIVKRSGISLPRDVEDDNILDLPATLQEVEKRTILKALEKAGGNIGKATALLNIPRTSLYYKLKKYGIVVERIVSDNS